jgi:hypothetical protein
MLQNPSNPVPGTAGLEYDPDDRPIRADGKKEERTRRKELTDDEDCVITKLEIQAGLLTQIARRLSAQQLEIEDARRICIATSFITQALRELERGTIDALDHQQIVFWE